MSSPEFSKPCLFCRFSSNLSIFSSVVDARHDILALHFQKKGVPLARLKFEAINYRTLDRAMWS